MKAISDNNQTTSSNASNQKGKVVRYINLECDGLKISVPLWDNARDKTTKALSNAPIDAIKALLEGQKFEVTSVNDANPEAPEGSMAAKLAALLD